MIDQEMDIYGLIDVEGVPCTFETSTERYELEPYTYGGARGYGEDVTATLAIMKLGGMEIDRTMACRIFGKEAIEQIEGVIEND